MTTQDLFIGPTGPNGNTYIFTGNTIDISSNSQSMEVLEQICDSLTKINCSDFHGIGQFSDYQNLYILANSLSQMNLDLSTNNLANIAIKANQISELLNSFRIKLETVLNLVTIQDLVVIRNSLCAILMMMETIENFTCRIEHHFRIRNEWMAATLSNTMNYVSYHLNCVFSHEQTVDKFPSYILDACPEIQCQIDRISEHSFQLERFAQSLDICPNLSTDS